MHKSKTFLNQLKNRYIYLIFFVYLSITKYSLRRKIIHSMKSPLASIMDSILCMNCEYSRVISAANLLLIAVFRDAIVLWGVQLMVLSHAPHSY